MSARFTERRWEGTVAVIAALALLPGLAGCSPFSGDDESGTTSTVATASTEQEVTALLHRRARALTSGSLTAFLASVDHARGGFVRRERTYFHNLRELPLRRFHYSVRPGSVIQLDDDEVQAVVSTSIRLRDYDRHAVVSSDLFTFRTRDDGSMVLAGDRDREFERKYDVQLQPWDLFDIEVIDRGGVLGVFDQKSVDAAYQIIPAIQDAIDDVSRVLPLGWNHRVVVYALSDTRVMASLDGLPGGDPDALDGVAFAVQTMPGSAQIAATRFMLHPRMVFRTDELRARLLRHELTHVAIGTRDDRVPKWLSEGLAEYVSVQPIPLHEREIAREALRMARRGLDALPEDDTFNGPLSGANYGIAWFACDYVATTYGVDALWQLFDAMRAHGGTTERDQDAVLQRVLGFDSHELARRAGRAIVQTFG